MIAVSRFFVLLAMFSLFNCGKKKAAFHNAEAWLAQNYPGQLVLLETETNFTWHNYDPNRYRVLIGSTTEPDVQCWLPWHQSHPDGGLDTATVNLQLAAVRRDLERGRALSELLKNSGLEKSTAGVCRGEADVLIYADPIPARREALLTALQTALKAWPETPETDIEVCFLEESAFGETFGAVMPPRFVRLRQTWKTDNTIYSLRADWPANPALPDLQRALAIHTEGKRADAYLREAHRLAVAWAEKHLPEPVFIHPADQVQYSLDERDLKAIQFRFPYCPRGAANLADSTCADGFAGYVCGVYQTEQGTWRKGRVENE